MNETFVKHLAGLLDADGCLSFNFRISKSQPGRYHVGLRLVLSAADSIDKHGFVESFPDLTGMGTVCRIPPNKSIVAWTVAKRPHLEMLLPRLIKHMVIKAKHWQWLLDTWRQYRGQEYGKNGVSTEEKEELSAQAKLSRQNVGPLKPKNHPSWAWLAGYLDGDGCFSFRPKGRSHRAVSACAHISDASVLDFIQKAFGGSVSAYPNKPHLVHWKRNLGHSQTSFALRFLPKLVKHSKFKKHKIEQMIRWHRQRLSDSSTVCSRNHCYKKIYAKGLCQSHYNNNFWHSKTKPSKNSASDSLNTS